jgi:hypothetical protein
MSVFFVRPRVSELAFHLFGRPLHPELFEILASRKVEREDYHFTAHITSSGHVITWQNADIVLTEVAAAVDQELPQKRRLLSYRLRGEHTGQVPCLHNIQYQMSFQVETLTPEIFMHVHDEILLDGGKRGLLHNFQPNHRLAVSPLGFVSMEARPGCLLWSTFHTFPEENTVIKSQSLIERRPAGKS